MTVAPSSCWRRAESAVPLRAWRAGQRAAIAAVLERAWTDWQQAWGVAGGCRATCTPSTGEGRAADWVCIGARAGAAAWLQLPPSFEASLSRALWDLETVDTPIAVAAQAACRRDLAARLAAGLAIDADAGRDSAVPEAAGTWSGALRADLPWEVRVVLNAQAVQGLQPGPHRRRGDPAALVPVAAAVADRAVPLRVHLADCELDIGSLRDLQPGDVLRLQHPLELPLQVRDASGAALFSASLARRRQFKAVQLGLLPSSASPSAKVPS